MLKTTITILTAGLLSLSGIQAQSIQEGINNLYAERNKTAKETFEKLIATLACWMLNLQGTCIQKLYSPMAMLL